MASSYSLTGQGLTPTSGGVDPLVVTVTGGNSSQLNLAAVACEVVATGASGSYVYAWTLRDPTNTDRTALLDDTTIDSPTFTPDIAGGSGQWVATCVVTSGGQTVTVTKTVTVGQKGSNGTTWVRVANIVSDGTTDASVSGGNIAWGGVVFAAPNAGVAVVDGDLVLTGQASTDLGRSGNVRTAALVTASLNGLAGLAEVGVRQVLIVLDVESYAPTGFNEALRVGVEQSSNPLGSGSNGRGIVTGHAFITSTVRTASVVMQSDTIMDTTQTSGAAASIAGVAGLFAGGSVRTYTRTTAYTDVADVLADTIKHESAARGSPTVPTYNQVVIAAARPTAGAGAACTIRGLQVWAR